MGQTQFLLDGVDVSGQISSKSAAILALILMNSSRQMRRSDLIGWDEKALIRPKRPKATGEGGNGKRAGKGPKRDQRGGASAAKGAPRPAQSQRPGKPPKANGRKGGIRKGR